ncbi:MAG: RNA polymerase subunit sigma-70 [Acidothermaceae bacterium]
MSIEELDDARASWDAALAGDREAFATATDRYRRELEVHCYRMLGSPEDAEDVVQETMLRAWRRRETYAARSTLRAWLYGISTNACLDVLASRKRRLLPPSVIGPADPRDAPLPASEIGWLAPYPDRLLDEIVDAAGGPEDEIVARETIELAFLVAIQHLPPRQRAVLLLRDVLSWSARETAAILDMSLIAANSALQRARTTVREQLPQRRTEWSRSRTPDAGERELLDRYMRAWNTANLEALVALLAEDARVAMPPSPSWYFGREAIASFLAQYPLSPTAARHIQVPTRANRQPAFALFIEHAGQPPQPLGISVLTIENGLIAVIDAFLQPELIDRFAVKLPA